MVVQQYFYSDIDPAVQQIARHRLQQLSARYPQQLAAAALQHAFTAFPADIQQVTTQQLATAVKNNQGAPWLVVAGWPCQDLSTAGRSRGMAGKRAQLLYTIVGIIGALQQLSSAQPPAYLLENVPFQNHHRRGIAEQDYQQVCSVIGTPVSFDAAQMGSLAHRLRNFWTNLCSTRRLEGALQHVQRPAGRTVSMALSPRRLEAAVVSADRPPFYPCNRPGQPRAAWPTLMGKPQSYAFRPGQAGSIRDCSSPTSARWDEPSAVEREVALGYLPGSTAAAGVSERDRCSALGQCMDANALQCLFAMCTAWWVLLEGDQAVAAAAQWEVMMHPAAHTHLGREFQRQQQQLSITAAAQEAISAGSSSSAEIWTDHPALSALQSGCMPAGLSHRERSRVQHRLKLYRWDSQHDVLLRVWPDGRYKQVPPPDQRGQLTQQQHERCGHFGGVRTAALLGSKYWWHGMLADARAAVKRCEHCSRARATFSSSQPELQSIPISSMGFRWHVDLAGPFPVSSRGSRYVMVAVEAFSKYLIAEPLPNKESATVAHAFLHHVLAVFAAPGQVVTDNGTEFVTGAFSQLLEDSLIDHCTTSVAHPRANGQAERAVQTVKTALRATCLQSEQLDDWDADVARLAMAYRCSRNSSTGFTPYELMFARPPVVPPAIRDSMQPAVDYDDPSAAAADLLRRQKLMQQVMPEALGNLSIAQHRDQRRYAVVRSGTYQPRTHQFQPGDYVYVKQQHKHSTLQPAAAPPVLRVVRVQPSGVLVLQGQCTGQAIVRAEHCAPCHLPDIDGTLDPVLRTDADTVCEVCSREAPASKLLLCDSCNKGFHTHCLQPPLDAVPAGSWFCPVCVQEGITAADVQARQGRRQEAVTDSSLPNLFPDPGTKQRDQAAEQLHGRFVRKAFADPSSGRRRQFWGKLHYRGPLFRPNYFLVVYEDGDEETLSMAAVKKCLQPAGQQLPAGVQIPELTQQQVQQLTAAAQGQQL